MLEHHDAMLVDRDDRMPGLRVLLDDEAFCARLQALCPGYEIGSARATYIRYKPFTSCLVAYEVEVGGKAVGVYARCHAEDQIVKVTNVRQRAEVRGELGHGLIADPEHCLAIFVHPNDYEIRSLRRMFDGEHTPHRLARILPAHEHVHDAPIETIRYKPERRFVGKLSASGGPAVSLRLYPASQYQKYCEKSWAFASKGALLIPQLVGDSARYCALAHEWVDGTPLMASLEHAPWNGSSDVLEQVALALGELHRQRPRLRTMYAASDYARAMTNAAETISVLDNDLGRIAGEIESAIKAQLSGRVWLSRAVHGDFTADQVLVQPSHIVILDYDRAGYGEPGMDVGAFVAGLIASALQGRLALDDALAQAAQFENAYRQANSDHDIRQIEIFIAGALMMMAPEPFRYRTSNWVEMSHRLLGFARKVLEKETIDA